MGEVAEGDEREGEEREEGRQTHTHLSNFKALAMTSPMRYISGIS